MTVLHRAVQASCSSLKQVLSSAVEAGVAPDTRHMLNAQQVLDGLIALENECRLGPPSRRMWSFGQAAIPVMSSTLNGLSKKSDGGADKEIAHCRLALNQLAAALIAFAEGRESV